MAVWLITGILALMLAAGCAPRDMHGTVPIDEVGCVLAGELPGSWTARPESGQLAGSGPLDLMTRLTHDAANS